MNKHYLLLLLPLVVACATIGSGSSGSMFPAVKSGNTQRVEELLSTPVDINIQDDNGETPLMAAASIGNFQMADFLIGHGANVNSTTKIG